jgi:vitamin B12 transporter
MKTIFHILIYATILLVWTTESTLFAADISADSSKVFYMDPYVVTATRSQILLKDSPSSVELVNKKQLNNANASNLGDALQYTSGIFIKDYGSASGLKTISIRGTSAEHTLILMNGNRLNNFQNGLIDLSLLPIDNIEKVEIIQGGNSALYGSDAIGGVINILTSNPGERMNLDFSGGVGSFGFQKYSLWLSDRIAGLGFGFGYSADSSKNNFKYKFKDTNQSVVKERENAGFKRDNFYLTSDYKFDKTDLKFYTSYTHSRQGIPGSISFKSTTASQLDKILSTGLVLDNSNIDNINLKLMSSFIYAHQNYKDPAWGTNSFSKNIHYSIEPQVEFVAGDSMTFFMGGQFISGKLDGTDYATKKVREQKSIVATSNISINLNDRIFNKINIYPAINYEKYSGMKEQILPRIGINMALADHFNLRSSYGLNYRIPTLNDLYYRAPWGFSGNDKLQPEYSINYDIGLNSTTELFGKTIFDLSYFYINTTDKISWLPKPDWTWSPENVGKVLSRGFSAKINWLVNENYELEISHTYTDTKKKNRDNEADPAFNKQLIYIPANMTKFGLNVHYSFISLNMNDILTGKRFIDEANTKSLALYNVINGNIIINIPTSYGKIWAKVEMNNILNRDYQVIYDYPMPLKNYKLTIGYEY